MSKYLNLSIKEIHELLKKKEIKPIDLVNEALEKVVSRVEYITYDEAKKQATYVRLPERQELPADIDEARLPWCPVIHHDAVVLLDILSMIPPVEECPVVASHQEHELTFGIVFREGLQGIPSIGWFGQVHLIV